MTAPAFSEIAYQPLVTHEPEVMGAREAARFLRLSRGVLYEACARGKVPHRKVGRKLIFSRTALVRWLSSCRDEGTGKV